MQPSGLSGVGNDCVGAMVRIDAIKASDVSRGGAVKVTYTALTIEPQSASSD